MTSAVVTCSEQPPCLQLAAGSAGAGADGSARSTAPTLCEAAALAWAIVLARVSGENATIVASVDRRAVHAGFAEGTLEQRNVQLRAEETVASALAKLRAAPLLVESAAQACIEICEVGTPPATVAGLVWACTSVIEPVPWLSHAGAAELRLHRRADFFDGSVATALLDAVVCVLAQLGDAQRELGALSVVSEAERHHQLVTWNHTARALPVGLRLESGFEAQVAAQPERIAVEDAHEALSFAELDARAARIASALAHRGVGPGDRVAVLVERGVALVAALLGVCKAGAAYVPLDPRYPDARLRFMWQDASCRVALTDARHSARCAAFAPDDQQLVLERVWSSDAGVAPIERGRPEDLAYVIYTSGSTGTPNGVAMSHRAVLNTLDWVTRSYGVGPGDRLLFVTSPCFDLSVYDVFGVLGAGATVVVAAQHELADPRALVSALSTRGITLWDSAPAAFQLVLTASDAELGALPLRLVMLSGDWVPLAMARRIRGALPGARLEVLGGATEAAIWSNAYSVSSIDAGWRSVPYGRPIQNVQYFVLDEAMRLLPRGVPGDLYIGGLCLAEGYVGRVELTRQRFVPSPFATLEPWGAPARLYRTGDRARFLPDDNLEFLGRSDHQLKVRGHRVELAEVEHALAQLPGVREAVVAPYTDPLRNLELCAYVVLEPGDLSAPSEIRRSLAEVLPSHMVPGRLMLLDALPVSSNGKVDRKALPDPLAGDTSAKAGPRELAPVTPTEALVLALWSRALGRADLGLHDNFFDLGGQSLALATLLRELELEHGLVVDLAAFLADPTAAGMACAARPRSELQRVASDVYVRPSQEPGDAWLVVGGGPFVLLQQTLAATLPGGTSVFFVWSSGRASGRLREALTQRRQLSALSRHGLPKAVRLLVLSGAEHHAEGLAARLRGVGTQLRALVRVDAAPVAACADLPTLVVRSRHEQLDLTEPGVLRHPGGHLAFLGDGAGSRVLAAIGRFGLATMGRFE